MVVVDVGVAVGPDIEIDRAMTGDLVEHVIEKGHARGETGLAAAVQVDADRDPGFQGVASYFGLPHEDLLRNVGFGRARTSLFGMIPSPDCTAAMLAAAAAWPARAPPTTLHPIRR